MCPAGKGEDSVRGNSVPDGTPDGRSGSFSPVCANHTASATAEMSSGCSFTRPESSTSRFKGSPSSAVSVSAFRISSFTSRLLRRGFRNPQRLEPPFQRCPFQWSCSGASMTAALRCKRSTVAPRPRFHQARLPNQPSEIAQFHDFDSRTLRILESGYSVWTPTVPPSALAKWWSLKVFAKCER